MKSIIYEGTIEHCRYTPVRHELSYPVYMYALDLDDLEDLNKRYPLFGYNRTGIASIMDKDYLETEDLPIRQKILRLLAPHKLDQAVDLIVTITSARYFNYIFNPVSFHYCYSRENQLAAIIAEVNNTYGERHPYILTENLSESGCWPARYQAEKVFHVSPFNTIDGTYHFYFSEPKASLEARIELVRDNKKIMTAVFKATGKPLTVLNHLKTMARHPFAPHLNIPRIYTHAFKLFFRKKLVFHDKPVPQSPMTLRKSTPGFIENVCMRLVLSRLKKLKKGTLKVVLPDGKEKYFGKSGDPGSAEFRIQDYGFFPRILFDGEIGLGESYMGNQWETPDLLALLTLLVENRDQFSDGNLFLSLITRFQEKIAHSQLKNTIKNTPENIAAHYDLSNDFYSLFLDQQMLYSCAIFKTTRDTLEMAQTNKMERILAQADIGPEHHLLEIGCGWGGFAVFAAEQTGCRVTGITVSRAQYEKACQRVKEAGLEDRIKIFLQDYRHTSGTFDRIVSIEMIEAVGPQFFGTYFKTAQKCLKPGGKMVFQAIIIEDDRYERYCRERDWIQKHIFPGGHLPCLKILQQTISKHTGFQIADVHHMGEHYATTLACWRERFVENRQIAAQIGFDDTFFRKWIYYFSICEAGFRTSGIDNIQVTLQA